jgi:hypothetical protein
MIHLLKLWRKVKGRTPKANVSLLTQKIANILPFPQYMINWDISKENEGVLKKASLVLIWSRRKSKALRRTEHTEENKRRTKD